MALTITSRLFDTSLKGCTLVGVTVAFDNSYPTGGEAVTAANLGLQSSVDMVVPQHGGAEVVKWDRATGKLLIYTADGTEATNASDQSAVTVDLLVFGK